MLWSLEARKQVDQEGMVWHVHDLKDALLAHKTAAGGEKKVKRRKTENVGMWRMQKMKKMKDWVEEKKDWRENERQLHIIRVYFGQCDTHTNPTDEL